MLIDYTGVRLPGREQNIINIMKNIRKYLIRKRANAIKREAELYFNGQVHHCCRVSANNHDIAYAITKVGIFGGPKVELIRKGEVVLSEYDKCVIIKDGYVYKLTKRLG